MTAGQVFTMATVAAACLLALVGILTGAYFVFAPFYFEIAGNPIPVVAAQSGASVITGISIAAVACGAAFALVYVQQAMASLLFSIAMSRVNYCSEQIELVFGSEARDRWLEHVTSDVVRQTGFDAGRIEK